MNKLIVILAMAIAVVSGCGKAQTVPDASTGQSVPVDAPVVEQAQPADTSAQNISSSSLSVSLAFTPSEVAQHASAGDCWQIISGKVYDVTSYVNDHPGGPSILQGCGTDSTAMFNGVGKHAGKAASMLAQYYKGDLKK